MSYERIKKMRYSFQRAKIWDKQTCRTLDNTGMTQCASREQREMEIIENGNIIVVMQEVLEIFVPSAMMMAKFSCHRLFQTKRISAITLTIL
jgi:hypothetical protein